MYYIITFTQDEQGSSALSLACEWGTTSAVSNLLLAGANVNLRTEDGDTALHVACQHSDDDTVECLINAGADVKARKSGGWQAVSVIVS